MVKKKKNNFVGLLFVSPSFSSRGTMATLTSTTPIFIGKFNPLASPYEDTKIVAVCDALDIELRFIRHVVVDLPRSRVIVATRLYLYIIDIGEYLLCTSSSSKAKVKNNSALSSSSSSSSSSLSSSSSSVIEKKAGRVKQFVIHECCDAICAVALDGNSGDVLVSWLDCDMSSRLAGTQRIDVLGNNTYYSFESYEYMIWFPGFNTVAHRARHAHCPFSYDSLELAQLMRKQEEKEEDNDKNNRQEKKKEGNEEHEHPTTTTTTTTKQIRAGIIGHIHDDCVLSWKAVLVYSTVCCDGTYSSVTSIPPKQCSDLDSKITHLAYFGANTLVATSSSQRHIRFLEVAFLSKEKCSVQSATSSSSESSRAEKKSKSKENVTPYSSSSSSLVRRSRIVAGRDLTFQEKEMEEKTKCTGHISANHLIIDGRGDCAVFACPVYSRVVNCERIFVADQGCIRVVTPLFLNDSCSKGSRASWLGQHPWTADTVMVSTIVWTNFHDTVFDMIGHGTALMTHNQSTLHLVEWSTQRDIQETFDANFSRLLPLSLVALISEYTCAY